MASGVLLDLRQKKSTFDADKTLHYIRAHWNNLDGKPSTYTPAAHDATHDTHNDERYLGKTANINEAYLAWGGKNHVATYGPIDSALVNELSANRFAFIPAAAITIEYSINNGATWLDYGATDAQKINFLNGIGSALAIGKNFTAGVNYTNYQLRITIRTQNGIGNLYTQLNKFILLVSTNGSSGSWCTLDARTQQNMLDSIDTWTTFANQQSIGGWSGYNVINTSAITTFGNTPTSQYGQIRFTFGCTGYNPTYTGLQVIKLMGFGGVGWTTPSNLAKYGNMYTYDYDQNVIFPAGVYEGSNRVYSPNNKPSPSTIGALATDDIAAWAKAANKPSYAFSDITGLIAASQLPAIAITDTHVTTTLADYVILYAPDITNTQKGDIIVCTTENKTYIHNGGTAGTVADFTLLRTPTDIVTSVNGAVGAVTLTDLGLQNVTNESKATMFTSPTFTGTVTYALLEGLATSTRDKIRVYPSSEYAIGMQSGITFGGLNDWAMTFQFNNENDRGFWWGDTSHTTAQGAMALTTNGILTVAHSVRAGYGESDTTIPDGTYRLDVNGKSRLTDQLYLTVADGTAPMVVTSTTKVTNLNANYLEGLDSSVFVRSDTGDTIAGNHEFYGTNTAGTYSETAIELREVNLVGNVQSADGYAPSISWHWGGRVQNKLFLAADGQMYLDGAIGTKKVLYHAGNLTINTLNTIPLTEDLTLDKDGTTSVGSHGIVFTFHNGTADNWKELNVTSAGTLQFGGTNVSLQGHTHAYIPTSHDTAAVTSTKISNWDTAYGWGNHAGLYRPVSWVPSWGDITGTVPTWNQNTTGNAASAGYAPKLVYLDGPRDLSDRTPSWAFRTVTFDFVSASVVGGSGNYAGVMTYVPWLGTTASTGDSSYQLAFANRTGINASGIPDLKIRNGIDTTWNAWHTIWHSGNDGAGSGLEADLLDGYHAASFLLKAGDTITGDFTLDKAGTSNVPSRNIVFTHHNGSILNWKTLYVTAAGVLQFNGTNVSLQGHTHAYIPTSHDTAAVTSTKIGYWDTAYGWGNHASAGYLTSLPGHSHDYITGIDDRDVKPNVVAYSRLQLYFTSLEGLTGATGSNWQDFLVLNSYQDSSGEDMNALAFDKSEMKIRHYFADQASSTWGTPKTLAYAEDVVPYGRTIANLALSADISVASLKAELAYTYADMGAQQANAILSGLVAVGSSTGIVSKNGASSFTVVAASTIGTINNITMNGSTNQNPTFYAPTTAGTAHYILGSAGSGAPEWVGRWGYRSSRTSTSLSPSLSLYGHKALFIYTGTSTRTVTIPANSSEAFPIGTEFTFIHLNTGALQIALASGVTVNGAGTVPTYTSRYKPLRLIKVDTDAWVLDYSV